MKYFILILIAQLLNVSTFAQPQPYSLLETKAQIVSVNTKQTTALYFPSAVVKTADRGTRFLLAQKEAGNGNVLKIKAMQNAGFPTTLYVFTDDGSVYAFVVKYADSLQSGTFTVAPNGKNDSITEPIKTRGDIPATVQEISQLPGENLKSVVHNRMKFQLRGIYYKAQLLYFRFAINNLSRLDFPIAVSRAYLQDSKQPKRTSAQQKDLISKYQTPLTIIKGGNEVEYIIAVPQFTILDRRTFRIELFEKDGGRHLSMRIKNRKIFNVTHL